MKKILLFTVCFLFIFTTQVEAQKAEKVKKEKTEKVKKEKAKKVKKEKTKGIESSPFIRETADSDDFQTEDRAKISKPEMPKYDVDQGFHATKKRKKQQDAFKNRKYFYPSKPNHAWQIGIFGGVSMMSSDVNPNFFYGNKPALPGHNFGAHVTKAWSYMFATRLRYSTYTMFNTDGTASTLTNEQFAVLSERSSGLADYNPGQQFFHNSRTQGHDLTLDFVLSFGNVAFHKERTKFNFKVIPIVGMTMYQAFYDHLDANGDKYGYADLPNLNGLNVNDRGEVLKALSTMRDGKYETRAEEHLVADENKILNYNPRFIFGIGGGFTVRLAKWVYLDIETRQLLMRDDLMDGMQWQEPELKSGTADSRGQTRNFDSYNQTTLGLSFNLVGKKTEEPLTMLNPMHYSYQKVAEANPEKAIDDLLKDDDGDGVPNRLDMEDDTPEGCPVGPKGIALDSDKDGISDCNDNEPFSPPGYSVDDKGVAIGTDADLKGKVEGIVNDMNICATCGGGGSSSCDDLSVEMPSVHFDKDKYNIKPEYYSHLYEVAQRLLTCPGAKVVATGMADRDDNTKYNEQLSYNRVDAVIDYLTKTYGVDRNRFIVKFNGESGASGRSASEQYEDRKVAFKLAEGETGGSNPSEPHPGMKAGKSK